MTAYSDVPEAENEDLTTWSLQKLTSGMNIYVQVEGHINASRELQRIESKLKKLSATIDKLKVKGCTKPLSDNENTKYDATSTKWGDLILVYNLKDFWNPEFIQNTFLEWISWKLGYTSLKSKLVKIDFQEEKPWFTVIYS